MSTATERFLIGVKAKDKARSAHVTATGLQAFPVALSGSLAEGPVTVQQIRNGGLKLVITLSCDLFLTPQELLNQVRLTNPNATIADILSASDAKAAGVDESSAVAPSPNLILVGMTSLQSSAKGWNRAAKLPMLRNQDGEMARISMGGQALELTLPPVEGYDPAGDETIQVSIPAAMLRSGRATTVPVSEGAIQVLADRADCIVSEWGPWSECDKICRPGRQFRQRSVASLPRGDGSTCPATLEQRDCNTCDPCSGVECQNGGFCVFGQCMCPPGYSGTDCSAPPPFLQAFWRTGEWGKCSTACGGGLQPRTVQCVYPDMGNGGQLEVAPSDDVQAAVSEYQRWVEDGSRGDRPEYNPTTMCDAAVMPMVERECNVQACSEAVVDVSI